MGDLPRLVIVSGAPASGKTTLAGHLARTLGLPLIARDALKEVLFETLGAPDRAHSRALGSASYGLLFAVTGWLLDAGTGAIIESNFHRGRSESELQPIVDRADAVLIHCHTQRAEIERRYRERFERGARHPGHHDDIALPTVLADVDGGVYAPPELSVPILAVDTTAGYAPDLMAIISFARRR